MPLLQSRLGLENARYNLTRAGSDYAYNMGEFLAMLGLEHDTETVLSGEISIVRIDAAAEALINEHLPKRPDIVSRRHEIERLDNAKNQTAFSSRAPSLQLSVDWGSRTFDPEFIDSLSGSARLSIPIDPWIPGTSRSQAIHRANLSVEKARLDLQTAEDSAKTQIRSLVSNLRNSWESIEIARLSLTVAERSYQLTEQGFLNGTVESLVLDDVRNNLANARQRLLQSELSYFNTTMDLSKALNMDWKDLISTFGVHSEKK
jgi:outer membrane protein TolC